MRITRDEMFKVVCMILTPSTGKVGTGCFISKDNIPYIVTAEHVQRDIKADTVIVFGENNSSNHIIALSTITKSAWIIHSTADIAAIELDQNKIDSRFNDRFFPYNQILAKGNSISRDIELTVAGFPNGLGTSLTGSSKFSPLTFRSYASSNFMSLERIDTGVVCDFFCLENPAMGGYSGGPILDLGYLKTPSMLQTYGDSTLLGIIHGTRGDSTGGKIAMVTPMYYLTDLLP